MNQKTAEILQERNITAVGDDANTFEVPSSDGTKTYTVKYAGSGDGDPDVCATWSCTCAAHGTCRHIRAVLAVFDELDEAGVVW